MAKVIDPSFPRRRHLLYEVAEQHAGGDWTGFDRSLQDFEVRNFANIYEQLGLLARRGVVDLEDVLAALSAQPMADWNTFEPIRTHIMQEAGKAFPAVADNQPGLDAIYWPNFRWLAAESRKWSGPCSACRPATGHDLRASPPGFGIATRGRSSSTTRCQL